MNKAQLAEKAQSYANQMHRMDIAANANSRRRGELAVMLTELCEAVRSGDHEAKLSEAEALIEAQAGSRTRYSLIDALIEAAINFTDGNDGAEVKRFANDLRYYTRNSIEKVRSTPSPSWTYAFYPRIQRACS